MSNQPPIGTDEHYDRIDADAVCEKCETVNPTGTLFCKTCGTNLRDQRMRRLSGEEVTDFGDEGLQPKRLLTGLLSVLGLLIVLYVGLNFANIEDWMARGLTEATTNQEMRPTEFWTGSESGIYEGVARFLEQNPVTRAEVQTAVGNVDDGFEGRYIIKRSSGQFAPIVGYGCVEKRGDNLYMVAFVGRDLEVRAKLGPNGQVQDSAAYIQGDYVSLFGFTQVGDDGAVYVMGQTALDETVYHAVAYRVP